MDPVVFYHLFVNRTEGIQPYMQCDKGKRIPRSRSASINSGVKCRPAVGAAALPESESRWSDSARGFLSGGGCKGAAGSRRSHPAGTRGASGKLRCAPPLSGFRDLCLDIGGDIPFREADAAAHPRACTAYQAAPVRIIQWTQQQDLHLPAGRCFLSEKRAGITRLSLATSKSPGCR